MEIPQIPFERSYLAGRQRGVDAPQMLRVSACRVGDADGMETGNMTAQPQRAGNAERILRGDVPAAHRQDLSDAGSLHLLLQYRGNRFRGHIQERTQRADAWQRGRHAMDMHIDHKTPGREVVGNSPGAAILASLFWL